MIKTREVELNVSVDGEGRPVVLVHGYTTTSNFWWHQIPDLARHYRAVRFDLRGHGDSGKPRDIAYDIEGFATDLRNVLDSLDIERAAIFGLSMGGAVVMQFANDYPERVAALGLISTTAHGLGERVQANHVITRIQEVGAAEASMEVIVHSFSHSTDSAIVEWAKLEVIKTPRYVAEPAIRALDDFDIRSRLSRFDFPTLIVVGAEDQITPLEHSRFLHEAIARSELHVIPGAAHFPMLEKPFIFNKIALNFLDGVKFDSGARHAASRRAP
ncbi:Pyruvate dehydrogenase E2 component (Dihydrolipoamide acetyltransferase) OS=Castellaniella defragrans OX=75697 GN=HNR28_001617 PE=4 SV=1 [Castellaniella defragrans]